MVRKNPERKRSIEHDGEDGWVGWDRILSLRNKARRLDKIHDTVQHTKYFVTIFETGGRESEVRELQPERIHWNEESIEVRRMEVKKRRKRFTRNVLIKREGNPLAEDFIEFVKNCETKYLLPRRTRFSGEIIPDLKTSQATIYRKITSIDDRIWPHWIRDQRSWHLSAKPEQGGRGFDSYLLKAWFEWATMEMPAHYAGRRKEKDIREALDINEIELETENTEG